MRLTNVAHLRLPYGRLWGYELEVSQPGAEIPVSFDQSRHVGAGDRPGSWMAMSFRPGKFSRDEIAAAWRAVLDRHGTFRTGSSPAQSPTEHRRSTRSTSSAARGSSTR